MAGTMPDRIAEVGAPGADLAVLLSRFEEALDAQHVADPAGIFRLATDAAREPQRRWRICRPCFWMSSWKSRRTPSLFHGISGIGSSGIRSGPQSGDLERGSMG